MKERERKKERKRERERERELALLLPPQHILVVCYPCQILRTQFIFIYFHSAVAAACIAAVAVTIATTIALRLRPCLILEPCKHTVIRVYVHMDMYILICLVLNNVVLYLRIYS